MLPKIVNRPCFLKIKWISVCLLHDLIKLFHTQATVRSKKWACLIISPLPGLSMTVLLYTCEVDTDGQRLNAF